MTDLLPIAREDMIVELKRELAKRREVYPKLVAAKRLPERRAERQIAVLAAVLELIERESTPIPPAFRLAEAAR